MVRTLGVHWLLGKLTPPAESINFQRTAQQYELSQAGSTLEKLIHFGYLYVIYPFASDAKDVVMRLHMAVITRTAMKRRDLARLTHLAKLLENPMDCGQRYVWMFPAYDSTDFFGAGMILRSDQRLNDGQALRGDRQPPLAATLHEFTQPPCRIIRTPARIK